MRVETVWMRESLSATAHLHRVYTGVLAGPCIVAECKHMRSRRAQVTNVRIGLCTRCEARESRLAREQVAA